MSVLAPQEFPPRRYLRTTDYPSQRETDWRGPIAVIILIVGIPAMLWAMLGTAFTL